jgi:LPPG:FO 2-phospho-L-lactate transferase
MREENIVLVSGGTGSAKLILGFKSVIERFTVIANVADNFWFYGLYVCPDVDISCYTLSGISDTSKGWGIAGDTFRMIEQIGKLGFENWFKLGDLDVATSIVRTYLLKNGLTLTEVTETISKALGIKQTVIPATDDHYETHILTPDGEMHLQEFWVKYSAKKEVLDVKYVGIENSEISKKASKALLDADRIILCPGNPITSIMPVLSLPKMRDILISSKAKKIAVSPIVGGRAFSGPACKFLRAKGLDCSSVSVARLYSKLIDAFVIHTDDFKLAKDIENAGVRCFVTDIEIADKQKAAEIAERLISI